MFEENEGTCLEPIQYTGGLVALGQIEIIRVKNWESDVFQYWKEMMEKFHYLKSGSLFGKQIKYLIHSSNIGWLGGLSFSSASWRLEERDMFIGWSDKERKENLHEVICNSRFLILPRIEVSNLASHILSLAIKKVSFDWQNVYGYKPALIETFVDAEKFKGTCYRAANWIYLGKTKGRGRNDRTKKRDLPQKDIYVYPLKNDFYSCEKRSVKMDWIEEEFQYVNLPNKSRKTRLLSMAHSFFAKPTENIPAACNGVKADIKGAYRFFSEKKIKMEDILISHYRNTVQRAKAFPIVLAVQDSSSLNYSTHKATEGLGSLSTEKGNLGLMMHDTIAITPEGIPLGALDVQIWSRDPKEYGKSKDRKTKPIAEKESYKWLKSFQAVESLSKGAPETMWVSVGDREADIFELFELANKNQTHLLCRSIQNRITDEEEKLWDGIRNQTPLGQITVQLPKSKKRQARDAQLELRVQSVMLKKPRTRKQFTNLTAILVSDLNTPTGEKPLDWHLLTTLEVTNFSEACEKVEWYTKRWGIEVFHRILKSGCKVEKRQLASADKITRCLSIDLVIAWRIFYLTMLGRETPDVGSDLFFEEAEWKTLMHYKYRSAQIPDAPPSLGEAISVIASIGGFVSDKKKFREQK
jgi:hypothetical protein